MNDYKETIDELENEFREDLALHLYSTVLMHQVNPFFPSRKWTLWPAAAAPDPKVTRWGGREFSPEPGPGVEAELGARDLAAKAKDLARAIEQTPRGRGTKRRYSGDEDRRDEGSGSGLEESESEPASDPLGPELSGDSEYETGDDGASQETSSGGSRRSSGSSRRSSGSSASASPGSSPGARPTTKQLLARIKANTDQPPDPSTSMLGPDSPSPSDMSSDSDLDPAQPDQLRFSKLKLTSAASDHKAELFEEMKAVLHRTVREKVRSVLGRGTGRAKSRRTGAEEGMVLELEMDVMAKRLCAKVDMLLQTVAGAYHHPGRKNYNSEAMDWQDLVLAEARMDSDESKGRGQVQRAKRKASAPGSAQSQGGSAQSQGGSAQSQGGSAQSQGGSAQSQGGSASSSSPAGQVHGQTFYNQLSTLFNSPHPHQYNGIEVNSSTPFQVDEFRAMLPTHPRATEPIQVEIARKLAARAKAQEFKRKLLVKEVENRQRGRDLAWDMGLGRTGHSRDKEDMVEYAVRYKGMRIGKEDYIVDF